MIWLYISCFVLAVGIYIWFVCTDVRRNLCQNLMALTLVFSSAGYIALGMSTNLEEALIAQKIVYTGGCFIPLLYFLTVANICRIDLKKKVMVPLIVFQLALFGLVCTAGYSQIYYKEASLSSQYGITILERSYGPTHFIYPLSMAAYFIASVTVVVLAWKKRKAVNRKELQWMIAFAAVALSIYIAQRAFKLSIDLTSISDIILILSALVPIYHSNLFTAQESRRLVKEQINRSGFITFDLKMNFVNCNDYASSVFDELNNAVVGEKLKEYGTELTKILLLVANRQSTKEKDEKLRDVEEKIQFQIHEKCYEGKICPIYNAFGRSVGNTLIFEDETEHIKAIALTSRYNEELTNEVNAKTEQIRSIQEKTILGMAQMVESRDSSTGGHIKRTSDVVRIFSKKLLASDLGLSARFLRLVERSAPMHDLGKIGVDDAILRKNGKYTLEEYNQMKKHAEIGGAMVKEILTGVEEDEFVSIAHNVANYHHEKVNGMGYPEGLKGEEIPLEARIMALADVFDALVSKRCYKEAFSYDEAFDIIKHDSGSHFDSQLAEVFLSCRKELEEYYDIAREEGIQQ